MGHKPSVTVESYPGPRGMNAATARRWVAHAVVDGHSVRAYGATRWGAERKAVRWAKERAKKYRRRSL